jgi:hypothetical protein
MSLPRGEVIRSLMTLKDMVSNDTEIPEFIRNKQVKALNQSENIFAKNVIKNLIQSKNVKIMKKDVISINSLIGIM